MVYNTAKYSAKVVQNGNSLHISIPFTVRYKCDIIKGDIVQIELKVLHRKEIKKNG